MRQRRICSGSCARNYVLSSLFFIDNGDNALGSVRLFVHPFFCALRFDLDNKQTDGQTDRWTDATKCIISPLHGQ